MLTTDQNRSKILRHLHTFKGVGWEMSSKLGRIYEERGRFLVRLPGGIRIFCDRQHYSFYSRQHAQVTLGQIQAEIQRGIFDPDWYSKSRKSLHSFEVYVTQWLTRLDKRYQRGDISGSHYRHSRHYVNTMFMPRFGHSELSEIKTKDIRDFFLDLECSAKTQLNIMSTLHKILAAAHQDELITEIPSFPKYNVPDPNWKWTSVEIQEKIFEHLDPEAIFPIYFLVSHGCRPGEARALTWADLDLQNDTITICKAVSDGKIRHTKSRRARVIPMDNTWKEMLLQQPRPLNPNTHVFLHKGKPLSDSWLTRKWNSACKMGGVDGLNLYSGSRHSFASQLVNQGASLAIIGRFLGHSTPTMTRRYAHLDMEPLRQVQENRVTKNRFQQVVSNRVLAFSK